MKEWNVYKLNRHSSTCSSNRSNQVSPIQGNLETVLRVLALYGINGNKDYDYFTQNEVITSKNWTERLANTTNQNSFQRQTVQNSRKYFKRNRNTFKPWFKNDVLYHDNSLITRKEIFKNGVRHYCNQGRSGDTTSGDDSENNDDKDENDAENIINGNEFICPFMLRNYCFCKPQGIL